MEKDELELMDGRTIVGYPKEKMDQRNVEFFSLCDADNRINLSGRTSSIIKEEKQKMKERQQRLFLDNAFMLIDAHEHILGDSRMFLTKVPIDSGLAYVGSEGLSNPTLGVYLEWWLNCPDSSVEDADGHKWLIFKLAGSALTWRNKCGLVDRNGNVKYMDLQTFRPVCEAFISINRRYKEAKAKYYAFSLLQTMSLLGKEGKATIQDADDFLFTQERKLQSMTTECNRLRKANEELTAKFHHAFMRLKAPELKRFLQELRENETKLADILGNANDTLRLIRERDSKTSDYQKERSRVRREKLAAIKEHNRLIPETLFDILEGEPIELHEVERFFGSSENEDKSSKNEEI